MLSLELIDSTLTNYQQLFCQVCLSSPLPIRDRYASSRPQTTLMFTESRALTLITTPSLPYAPQKRSPSAPLALRGTRVVFLLLKQFSPKLGTGARSHPHTTHQSHFWRD